MNFAQVPWVQGGAGALLALTVWLILTGRIVPRATLRDVQAERDKWEAAATKQAETIGELAQQVTALAEIGRTSEALLRSIVGDGNGRDKKKAAGL